MSGRQTACAAHLFDAHPPATAGGTDKAMDQGGDSDSVKQNILINVSGEDRPGLTSSLTAILAEYNANVLDIGQAVIHDTLSLGMLVEVPAESESSPVLKDVLFKGHELGVTVRFTPVSEEDYEHWV